MEKLNENQKRMVEENTGLIWHEYHHGRYNYKIIDFEDVLGIGSIGLCKAVKAFKPELGYAFSTFAIPVIRFELLMHIRKLSRKKDIPCDFVEDLGCHYDTYFKGETSDLFSILNEKEISLVKYLEKGYTQVQIGELIGVSQCQVSRLKSHIKKKLAKRMDKVAV